MERVLFILGLLEDEDVDWWVSAGHRQEVFTNEVLIQEGTPNTAIYLILSGQFVVSVARSPGTQIAHLSSGEVVGEMSFIDHLPSSATVKATEPSVVLAIDRAVLSQKLAQDVSFACRWYHALTILLSTRLRGTVRCLEAEFWKPFTLEQRLFSADMTDSMELGGIRFDWLMRRLRDIDVSPQET